MKSEYTERFFQKVDKEKSAIFYNGTQCWEWTAGCFPDNYGAFWNGNKMVGSHRISYEMEFGEIPEGLCVCHKCDNPICVRPEHLFLGTQQDNVNDMMKKGRQGDTRPKLPARGESNGKHKLSDGQVAEIRRRGDERNSVLAKEFGVSSNQISLILKFISRKGTQT